MKINHNQSTFFIELSIPDITVWCGFKSDQWLQVLEEEITYRNHKVNFFIKGQE